MSINISGYLLSKVKDKDFAYSIIRVDNEIPRETISILLENTTWQKALLALIESNNLGMVKLSNNIIF